MHAVSYWRTAALLWLFASGAACRQKTGIHFPYITAKTGSFVSSGGIPAVDLALEQINNRTDILPNYNLSYTTILDSKVTEIHEYKKLKFECFYKQLYNIAGTYICFFL